MKDQVYAAQPGVTEPVNKVIEAMFQWRRPLSLSDGLQILDTAKSTLELMARFGDTNIRSND
ncbi:hypothetical protein PITCH_A1940007 [uncultured Desulfobacterium sp.]|uniref:Uncharacterized protein n=1 Tax=uncultured Desulfobacterium sp. TaxID=201089 RepID=A0A445MW86_9BACT|nr:hypothetical protein PITCH_A1940007 [uncultured Desulfobacterium sp.]